MRPTPCFRAVASSSVDLLLPCRTSRSGGDAGRERHVELATGRDVEVHALLVGQAGHGAAQEGLGGVGDAVAPGRDRLPAGVAQVLLVVDEERGAELLDELQEVDAADVEVAPLVDRGRTREEMPLQRCGGDIVVRRHGEAGYGSIRPSRESGEGHRQVPSTIVPCSCNSRPRSSADRAPASGAGGAGSSPAGGAKCRQEVPTSCAVARHTHRHGFPRRLNASSPSKPRTGCGGPPNEVRNSWRCLDHSGSAVSVT